MSLHISKLTHAKTTIKEQLEYFQYNENVI